MSSIALKQIIILASALAIMLISPFMGMTVISPLAIFEPGNPDSFIFWTLRVPRSLGGFIAGAGLGLGGLIFQTMFRNPLATPYTLGIASGGAFGTALYFQLGAFFTFSTTPLLAALAGSLTAMLGVYFITKAYGGFSTTVMLLAGIIMNFFFSSLMLLLQYLGDPNDLLRLTRWLLGSLVWLQTPDVVLITIVVCLGAVISNRITPELNLLLTGEELAESRGVNVRRVKLICFITASCMVGFIVALTGPIGFVGMMAPQLCRLWLGVNLTLILPASLLVGGSMLAFSDAISRLIFSPVELPVGIITALTGAPFFLWVMLKNPIAKL